MHLWLQNSLLFVLQAVYMTVQLYQQNNNLSSAKNRPFSTKPVIFGTWPIDFCNKNEVPKAVLPPYFCTKKLSGVFQLFSETKSCPGYSNPPPLYMMKYRCKRYLPMRVNYKPNIKTLYYWNLINFWLYSTLTDSQWLCFSTVLDKLLQGGWNYPERNYTESVGVIRKILELSGNFFGLR